MGKLVREKGQITVPRRLYFFAKPTILDEINQQKDTGNTISLALVFHNEEGLTDELILKRQKRQLIN